MQWNRNSDRSFYLYCDFHTMEVNGYQQLLGYPHSLKCLLLCSAEERNSYMFGTMWVNEYRIFIFGWTICLIFFCSAQKKIFWKMSLWFKEVSGVQCCFVVILCCFYTEERFSISLNGKAWFYALIVVSILIFGRQMNMRLYGWSLSKTKWLENSDLCVQRVFHRKIQLWYFD